MEMRENKPKQDRKVTQIFDSGVDHEDDEDTLEDLDSSNNNPGIGLEDDGGRRKMSLLLSFNPETTIDDWACLCRLNVQPSEPNLLNGRHRFPRVAGLWGRPRSVPGLRLFLGWGPLRGYVSSAGRCRRCLTRLSWWNELAC
jgi:hypothetical protein